MYKRVPIEKKNWLFIYLGRVAAPSVPHPGYTTELYTIVKSNRIRKMKRNLKTVARYEFINHINNRVISIKQDGKKKEIYRVKIENWNKHVMAVSHTIIKLILLNVHLWGRARLSLLLFQQCSTTKKRIHNNYKEYVYYYIFA